jgi:hypothetical protein
VENTDWTEEATLIEAAGQHAAPGYEWLALTIVMV